MKKIIQIKKRALPVRGITSADDLYRLADRLGVRIDGIVLSDDAHKLPKLGSFIILLKGPHSNVGHWTCRYNHEYFDSMGASPPSNVAHVKKWNDIQYQGTYDEYCGPWCLLWLLSKQKNNPKLMGHFYDLEWN